MMNSNVEEYVTVAVACQLLGVSDATIRRFIKANQVDGYDIKREYEENTNSAIEIRKEFLLNHQQFKNLRYAKKNSLAVAQLKTDKNNYELLEKLNYVIKIVEGNQLKIDELLEENKALQTSAYEEENKIEPNFILVEETNNEDVITNKWWKFW